MDAILRQALASAGVDAYPKFYTGGASRYCTYSFDTVPIAFGDNGPTALRLLVSVHFYAPQGENVLATRAEIMRQLVLAAGCTYPTEMDDSDATGQHYVYECEAIDKAERWL